MRVAGAGKIIRAQLVAHDEENVTDFAHATSSSHRFVKLSRKCVLSWRT
jgi:hypothetical protein